MKGTVTKRGKGRYLIRLFIGRDPVTGKQLRPGKTVHGTRKEADRALREWMDQYESGRLPSSDRVSLNQYLKEWLEVACKPRVSARTHTDHKAVLDRYVKDTIGLMPLSKVTPLDIQGLYADMQSRGLSARTIRLVHSPLSQALKQAVRWRKLAFNPASEVDLPKAAGGRKREVNPLTSEEANLFLDAAAASPWSALFQLALASGMRPGEYFALQWDCVDWNGSLVRVERAVSRPRGQKPFLGPPKTKKSRRSIPLPPEVMESLREHRISQNAQRLRSKRPWDSSLNLVFPNRVGGIMNERNYHNRMFNQVMESAGLEGHTPYDLRHTCATLLLLANVHPKVVSERLGHSTISQTLDTYSHVLPTMQQSATDAIGSLLFRSS